MFGAPKPPKPPPPPANAPIAADASADVASTPQSVAAASLISTGAQGLRRRAQTQRTSLLGGGY